MKSVLTTMMDDTQVTTNYKKPENFTHAGGDLKNQIVAIINAVIGVLGLICVVVIILGGIQYMTSSGDSGKVKKAKDTILYGIIGLVICVLAFAIVNFVIGIL